MSGGQTRTFCFLCWIVYFTSYLTRLNFSAVIAAIIESEGYSKTDLSLVVTCGFIMYGFGQLVSGFLGDKISPEKLIFAGLSAIAVFNALLPFCASIFAMTLVWSGNGLAQAMLWPPLVKMITTRLDHAPRNKTITNVSLAGPAGTIAVYLAAPLFIQVSGWRLMFIAGSLLAVFVAFLWLFRIGKFEPESEPKWETEPESEPKRETERESGREAGQLTLNPKILMASGMIPITIAIILQGALRDGVSTWMPSFISETFNLGSSVSILSAVILPLFAIFSIKITAYVYQKKLRSASLCAGLIFFAGSICCVLLMFVFRFSVLTTVLLTALMSGCMHGVNFALISIIPTYYEKFGCVSTMSGILNSFTYAGSALSSYGFAKAAESAGWLVTIGSWVVIALAGSALCFISAKRMRSFLLRYGI
ncbi:MAG: MFS transporter [Clostridiales bacterium]|nr:MFS transporter [Clostridiales bacterium]